MISYKSEREIAKMRAAGRVIARVFELVQEVLRPGITTLEIDAALQQAIRDEFPDPDRGVATLPSHGPANAPGD